jgi:hypothetical protein
LWIGAFAAHAANADWEVVPDIEMTLEARDNPRLNEGQLVANDDASSRMLFDGRFAASNVSERGEMFIQPRLRLDAYTDADDDELESDDYFFDMRGRRRWETASAGFFSYFSRESILHSEILEPAPIDPDVEEPVDADTGQLVQLDEHRNRLTLGPYVDVQISERSTLTFDARHIDVDYSGTPVLGRTDFDDTRFSTGISRKIDDRNRAGAKLFVQDFEADATQNQTDTLGLEGTFSRIISEIWTFTLATGVQRSDITFLNSVGVFDDEVETNYTLGLGFRKRADRSRLNLDIRRLIDPNSSGFLEQRNEFRMSMRRQMNQRLIGGFGFRAIDTNAVTDELPVLTRDYARIGLSLEWALSRQWGLRLGYDGIYQKFQDQTRDETSNSVSVGLNYRGLSRTNPRTNAL